MLPSSLPLFSHTGKGCFYFPLLKDAQVPNDGPVSVTEVLIFPLNVRRTNTTYNTTMKLTVPLALRKELPFLVGNKEEKDMPGFMRPRHFITVFSLPCDAVF